MPAGFALTASLRAVTPGPTTPQGSASTIDQSEDPNTPSDADSFLSASSTLSSSPISSPLGCVSGNVATTIPQPLTKRRVPAEDFDGLSPGPKLLRLQEDLTADNECFCVDKDDLPPRLRTGSASGAEVLGRPHPPTTPSDRHLEARLLIDAFKAATDTAERKRIRKIASDRNCKVEFQRGISVGEKPERLLVLERDRDADTQRCLARKEKSKAGSKRAKAARVSRPFVSATST